MAGVWRGRAVALAAVTLGAVVGCTSFEKSTTPFSSTCSSVSLSRISVAHPAGAAHPSGTRRTAAGGGVFDDLASAQIVSTCDDTMTAVAGLRQTI